MQLSEDVSSRLHNDRHLRTLFTSSSNANVEGLLYVPDLEPSDPCFHIAKQHVPDNATRKADLPSESFSYVAVAPWISAPCTRSYMTASSGVSALLTYFLDNVPVTPPPNNNEVWHLQDRGQWQNETKFPVIAVPGAEGARIMRKLGQYSGRSSDPYQADALAKERLDPSDYVRLYAQVAIGQPGLSLGGKIALCTVLGVIGLICIIIWVYKSCVKPPRRRNQRRLSTGNVDLTGPDAMNQHLAQAAVNSLPTIIYSQHDKDEDSSKADDIPIDSPANRPSTQAVNPTTAPGHAQWAQTTCSICLEDYVSDVTMIRRLLCGHAYHPDCIAKLIKDNILVCPICRATVIPHDPSCSNSVPVTNAMVQADHSIRRNNGRRIRNNPLSYFRRVLRRSDPEVAVTADTTYAPSPIEMAPLENRSVISSQHTPASSGGPIGVRSSLDDGGPNQEVEKSS